LTPIGPVKQNDIKMEEKQLIFIISQPRSGSTYLQSLLSNNHQVNTCSEPWIILNYISLLKPETVKTDFNMNMASRAFKSYLSNYPEFNFREKLRSHILENYEPMATNFKYVIDKTPRYYGILGEMLQLFPNSKFIILKRNPIDVARSIMTTWNIDTIKKIIPYKSDILMAPIIIDNFLREYSSYSNIYEISYEKLINNEIEETKNIYDWLGIDFSSKCIDFSSNQKVKGEFGDPYINANLTKDQIENLKPDLLLWQKKFILGYGHYLSQTKFSNYSYSYASRKTATFQYFRYSTKSQNSFKENFKLNLYKILS